jgi:tRNA 5-methylaminomethyl-2-thiouridine biosynthesis bifunctional protein
MTTRARPPGGVHGNPAAEAGPPCPDGAQALARARQLFLAGNGLPAAWQQRPRFVVLDTGFGAGHNFLATWAAWREDPQRCAQLVYLSMAAPQLAGDDLARTHAASPLADLAAELLAQWPPLTPDLHTLEFAGGQVRLLLARGDVARWQGQWVAAVDAFYLDDLPPSSPMQPEGLCKSLARLAAVGATAATCSEADSLRAGLGTAGFELVRQPGQAGGPGHLAARMPHDLPAARRRPAPPGRRPAAQARDALVIGAGLAGAAAARALARDGLAVRVLERRAAPGQETSGNLAGLFHGVLHAQDGNHAQLLRAAALRAAQVLAPLVADGSVPGQCHGLLRGADGVGLPQQALAQGLSLPADYVQALDRASAATLAGVDVTGPQWLYPGGGWIQPAALVQHWLEGPGIRLQTDLNVARLQPTGDGRWQALDAHDRLLAEADVLVLACAHDSARLLQAWTDVAGWALERRRGQVTQLPAALARSAGLPAPRLPLASGGYLISLPDRLGGGLLCGATSQLDDEEAGLRSEDHRHNLRQMAALTGHPACVDDADLAGLPGRVGWRLACADRLPLVGPVPAGPAERAGARQLEQARQVPRVPGLYVLGALGSRGITLAPLLGEVLSAWITGAPVPLAADLMDAIDPARWVSRALRRSSQGRHGD